MDLDLNNPEVKAAIETAAAALNEGSNTELNTLKQSVTALEGNNAKLLQEKREASDSASSLKEMFESLGGEEGVGKLKEAQAETEKAAAFKMLVEGNFEEFQAAITEKAVANYQKQLGDERDSRGQVEGERDAIRSKYNDKLVDIAVRDAASKADVHPTAIEDIVFRAQQSFSVREDAVGVFDENGIMKPGSDGKTAFSPTEWLEEQRDAAPHWWPASQGGGAAGSQGGTGSGSDNPWSVAGWNLTKQGQVVREQGATKAEALAKAAGSKVGATRPSRAA
jgi:hypothetical protein